MVALQGPRRATDHQCTVSSTVSFSLTENCLDRPLVKSRLGATVIVVSHRPSLLAGTDNIAVLNQGALVKVGSRDQILSELSSKKLAPNALPTPANS